MRVLSGNATASILQPQLFVEPAESLVVRKQLSTGGGGHQGASSRLDRDWLTASPDPLMSTPEKRIEFTQRLAPHEN